MSKHEAVLLIILVALAAVVYFNWSYISKQLGLNEPKADFGGQNGYTATPGGTPGATLPVGPDSATFSGTSPWIVRRTEPGQRMSDTNSGLVPSIPMGG
jgi:hypothetical protein